MQMIRRLLLALLIGCCLPFVAEAQERAVPKDGDGIEVFLKRHGRIGSYYRKEFIRLNQGKFGKNNSLKLGTSYILPPRLQQKSAKNSTRSSAPSGKVTEPSSKIPNKASKARKGYEPLFGPTLAHYKPISNELQGACFYLVSGHGGPDPGAIGRIGQYELHEDEYAYDVILRIARNLLMRGAKVHIIIQDSKDGIRDAKYLNNSHRETCMGSRIPLNQVARLQQRCEKINALARREPAKYKRALFLHVDSRSKSKQTDVFFYHTDSKASKRLANQMKNVFQQKYDKHQPGRGFKGTVSSRNLYVLRNTTPVSAFVEIGNIQNKYDQQRIILSNNRQAMANWISEAFVRDYKNSKK